MSSTFGKTPVSALQEYCARKRLESPVYTVEESVENSSKVFVCIVEAVDSAAEGKGRSKQEARHDAATNLLKQLANSHPDLNEVPQATHGSIPLSDAVIRLRDLCLQQDQPFPSFNIIQQCGPPEAPEFHAECRLSSIVRYGVASTKKGAKQIAARKVLDIFEDSLTLLESNYKDLVPVDQVGETKPEKNHRNKIRTYLEYVNLDNPTPPGVRIRDRHTYYEKYDPELKQNAINALKSESYQSDKEKAVAILDALQIKYREGTIPDNNVFKCIEIKCEYDAFFANIECKVWGEVIRYFKTMLY